MKKFIFIFAIVLTFCFIASAQFSFTSKKGKEFSVDSAPQKTEMRGGGFVMEFYYTVEGSDLVVYEVGKSKGVISNSIAVIVVPIDEIDAKNFKVKKWEYGCYLQSGTSFTKITHGSDYDPDDKYTNSNLQMDFKNCDDAEELRKKVLGDAADDIDLGDLDLDLEDKPKEKPKSTMPAHLFGLIGGSKIYQLNRRTNEIWDMTTNNVFKIGKIDESGDSLRMLVADESYFTYNVKDGKLYNSEKYLGYKLTDGVVCKSGFDEMCFERWEIDRSDNKIYRVFKSTERFEQYKIMGEATDEEILLIFAFVDKLK